VVAARRGPHARVRTRDRPHSHHPGIGILIGLVVVLAGGRVSADLLYGIEPTDPAPLAAVAASLLLVAVLAAYVPARQATRVDPLEVLRSD
jgi:ABC-type antimicrobial peptide transport system permease subunit